MEAKDVIAFEKQISDIVGQECQFEYIAYDGAARISKENVPSDGTLRDSLNSLKARYHQDYFIFIQTMAKSVVSQMRTYQLPGCCGICVSSAAHVSPYFRNRGINTILNKFRIEFAKHLGYTVLMCTDISNNKPEKQTLIKNGWKDIHHFINQRTNNGVDISIINLI